jgi:hypothetical protein
MRLRSSNQTFQLWDESAGAMTFSTGVGAKTTAMTIEANQDVSWGGVMVFDTSADKLTVGDGGNADANIQVDATAAGSPWFGLRQSGALKAYWQYVDSGDRAVHASDGTIEFHPNNTLAVTFETDGSVELLGAATVAGGVDKLTNATGVVSVAAAAAPTVGQVLTATSSTVATWQAGGGGGGGPTYPMLLGGM